MSNKKIVKVGFVGLGQRGAGLVINTQGLIGTILDVGGRSRYRRLRSISR